MQIQAYCASIASRDNKNKSLVKQYSPIFYYIRPGK